MSRLVRVTIILFAVLTICCAWLALLEASPLQAQTPDCDAPCAGEAANLILSAPTTADRIEVMDLRGNVIGDGEHWGELTCDAHTCSGQTKLLRGYGYLTDTLSIDLPAEFEFTTRQEVSPVEGRVVAAGIGTLSIRGRIERFSFTAVFQNNRDGTVSARYEASQPDASFVIPRSPGTVDFQ